MVGKDHETPGHGARRNAARGAGGDEAANPSQRQYSDRENYLAGLVTFVEVNAAGQYRYWHVTTNPEI